MSATREEEAIVVARASDQIDALIEKRAAEHGEADAVEEMWERSEARDKQRRRREVRALWYSYFSRLAESHKAISERFEEKARGLLEEPANNGK